MLFQCATNRLPEAGELGIAQFGFVSSHLHPITGSIWLMQYEKGVRKPQSARTPAPGGDVLLPEKVVNHVFDIAGAGIDEDHVIIIAHPAITIRGARQAVASGLIEPIAAAEEQRV